MGTATRTSPRYRHVSNYGCELARTGEQNWCIKSKGRENLEQIASNFRRQPNCSIVDDDSSYR
jgi:hypothetical protein